MVRLKGKGKMPSMHPYWCMTLASLGLGLPQYEGPFLPQPLHAQPAHFHPDVKTQVQFGSDLLVTAPTPNSRVNDTLMEEKKNPHKKCVGLFFLDPQFKGNIETTFL